MSCRYFSSTRQLPSASHNSDKFEERYGAEHALARIGLEICQDEFRRGCECINTLHHVVFDTEQRSVRTFELVGKRAYFFQNGPYRSSLIAHDLATDQIVGLDPGCPFVDRC